MDTQWRKRRESLGLLMGYYHPGHSEIGAAWRQLRQAIDRFNRCAVDWATQHPRAAADEVSQACGQPRDHVRGRIDALNASLDEARTYLWERFGVLPAAASPRQ